MSTEINPPAVSELDEASLRSKAIRRSWACPGSGSALLGRKWLAIATYLASMFIAVAIAWLVFDPGPTPFIVAAGIIVVGSILWAAEQIAVRRISPQIAEPRFLVRGFFVATAAMWLMMSIVLIAFFIRFGFTRLAGNGMSPTLEQGEMALYEKRVDAARLRRGTLILFGASDRSAWGKPGWLVIARILAGPGDQLSVQRRRYLVNGEAGPAVATADPYQPVLRMPREPDTLTIPDDCFFVVQDSPKGGYDSRVLSLIETKDVVSTRLFYLGGKGLFKPVK